MAVYPDKKNGKLNGRWRVEVQKYRKRFDTHAEAVADEARVKALVAAGEAPCGPSKASKVSQAHCIASISQEASKTLWAGTPSYRSAWHHIGVIGEIIGSELPIDEIETPHLTKVIRELTKTGIKDPTVNRYLSHFRTFMIWAQDEGLRTVPVANLKFRWLKENPGRLRWITAEEEAQLKVHLPRKVWTLVKVAIETGCRLNELLSLEPRDIRGNLMHLWITKTKFPRTVPLSDETAEMVNWLLDGNMPSQRSIRSWWDRAKAKMGLQDDKQFVFHLTRHTCATRMVDVGEDVLVIKEWLGHKRLETTQRYAHVKPSNLQDALKRRGIAEAIMAQEALKTAGNTAPPPTPTGGVNDPETARKAA